MKRTLIKRISLNSGFWLLLA